MNEAYKAVEDQLSRVEDQQSRATDNSLVRYLEGKVDGYRNALAIIRQTEALKV